MKETKAKNQILQFLKNEKKNGIKKVSIIDLVSELNLPATQIEEIMDGLEGNKI